MLSSFHKYPFYCMYWYSLQWRHNEREGVSNHEHPHCLHSRLFSRRSKKTSAPEQAVEQTIETPVIWDGMELIMTSLQWICLILHAVSCTSNKIVNVAWNLVICWWNPHHHNKLKLNKTTHLIICDLATQHGHKDLRQHWFRKWLLLDGTKPSPDSSSVAFIWGQFGSEHQNYYSVQQVWKVYI